MKWRMIGISTSRNEVILFKNKLNNSKVGNFKMKNAEAFNLFEKGNFSDALKISVDSINQKYKLNTGHSLCSVQVNNRHLDEI